MSNFHKLIVNDVTRETTDCVSFAFDIPDELKKEFSFVQGQYITLKLAVNGEDLRRCYSVCTSPHEGELRVAAKKVIGGRVSTWLNEKLQMGDEVEVMPPMGNFYSKMDAAHEKTYVLFAGGSGITPVLSILKTVLEDEPNSNVILFYGNLNETATIFKDQLDELAKKFQDRLQVHYILDKPETEVDPINQGILSAEKTKSLLDQYVDISGDNEYFLCGPPGMKDGVLKTLEQNVANKETIHVEVFTVDTVMGTDAADQKEIVGKGFSGICSAVIVMDGDEFEVDIPKGKVVLQAVLDSDIDAPYSCRGGMCMTCRAKLTEGSVEMEKNFALTDTEVDEGYILTCQSHPTTDKIAVDYDAY
jgi:ring-1,2-phenylacetyl-CoA epoxidase subunit PaaE